MELGESSATDPGEERGGAVRLLERGDPVEAIDGDHVLLDALREELSRANLPPDAQAAIGDRFRFALQLLGQDEV